MSCALNSVTPIVSTLSLRWRFAHTVRLVPKIRRIGVQRGRVVGFCSLGQKTIIDMNPTIPPSNDCKDRRIV